MLCIKLNILSLRIRYFLICLAVLCTHIGWLSGQTDIRLLNAGSGLADETVRALYLHQNGMLYLGTSVGLSVFDGENIVNISTSLKQEVKNIIPHGSDSLILIRDNAITVINLLNYGYREKDYNASQANKIVYAVRAGGYLYCATNNGLVKIEINKLTYENLSEGITEFPKEIFYSSVKCIAYSDLYNRLYIGHRNGMLIWDIKRNNLIKSTENIEINGLKASNLEVHGDKLYFINNFGFLTEYSEKRKINISYNIKPSKYYIDKGKIFYISGNTIYGFIPGETKTDSIVLDKKAHVFHFIRTNNGEILLATRSGLVLAKKSDLLVNQTLIPELSKEINILELQRKVNFRSSFYFNTRNGISELDTVSGVTRIYKVPAELKGKVLSIIPYGHRQFIVTGLSGYCGFDLVTRKYFRLKLFSRQMDSLIESLKIITGHYDSAAGILLLCPYRHPVIIKDLKTGTESTWNGNDRKWFRTVRSLYYLGNREYLFGANGNDGLIRINLNNQKGRHYPAAAFSMAGNNSAIINQIIPFDGVFYLATSDGLVRFEPESGKLSIVQVAGFPYHDQVYAMAVINGQLFATTRNALCKLTGDLDLIRLYTYENYSGAGVPFQLKNEVNYYVKDKLISIRIPDGSDTSFAYISHIGSGGSWQYIGSESGCQVDYGVGSLHILFGSKLFVRNKRPLVIKYRFSGSAEWQLLKGSSFETGNLDYGVHTIEYYSIYLGRKSPVKRFKIEVRRPWWASYWFYAFCLLAVVLLVYVFLKWKLRQKDRKEREQLSLIINASETERSRISREFHDGLGTRLSTVKLIAEGSRAGRNAALLEKLPEIVDEIIVDVRNIINELSPQSLKQYGLQFALKSHVHGLSGQLKDVEVSLNIADNIPRLDEHAEINVFRICQELISNAVRHSGGNRIHVSMSLSGDSIMLVVSDNGTGMPKDLDTAGHGLGNIKSRVLALNGEISFMPAVPQGTEVKIILPLRP